MADEIATVAAVEPVAPAVVDEALTALANTFIDQYSATTAGVAIGDEGKAVLQDLFRECSV